jgi:hypothetical protein
MARISIKLTVMALLLVLLAGCVKEKAPLQRMFSRTVRKSMQGYGEKLEKKDREQKKIQQECLKRESDRGNAEAALEKCAIKSDL